jgi:hypothetical protein
MEGSANGAFASFGVVDLQSPAVTAQLISLNPALTQAKCGVHP